MNFHGVLMLTQARLKELFNYHSDGFLVWKAPYNNRVKEGDRLGQSLSKGYRQTGLGRHCRLVWVWHNGAIPDDKEIDHWDRNRSNDRIENLRLKTRTQNNYNTKMRVDSTQSAKGVEKRGAGYSAYFSHKGVKTRIGVFKTVEEAVAARNEAMRGLL